MTPLAELPFGQLVTLIAAVVTAIVAPVTWAMKGIFGYLTERIRVLEGREQVLLAALAAGMAQQGEELEAQGALIRQLAKDGERRDWLRDRERGGGP